jgi:hypothetical protein
MSAAATAAGYLYASGRLRGKGAREGAEGEHPREPAADRPKRKEVRVAVYPPHAEPAPQVVEHHARPAAKKTPKIEYRTRRWRPE